MDNRSHFYIAKAAELIASGAREYRSRTVRDVVSELVDEMCALDAMHEAMDSPDVNPRLN